MPKIDSIVIHVIDLRKILEELEKTCNQYTPVQIIADKQLYTVRDINGMRICTVTKTFNA